MRILLSALGFAGAGLSRPACVVTHASDLVLVPDWTGAGGIAVIDPSGRTRRILATRPDADVPLPLRPAGIALEPGGSVLLAHLGASRGAVCRLHPDGRCSLVTDRIDGAPMPPAQSVALAADGALWITVATTRVPRARAYRRDAASGLLLCHRDGVTRIAAEGLGYPTECRPAADGKALWVAETFARRLSAFALRPGGVGPRRTVAEFGAGDFPGGVVETTDGGLLVTSIISNRLLRVTPDGRVERILEDADPAHLAAIEAAFVSGGLDRAHLETVRSRVLGHLSGAAFGGANLRRLYLGSLLGESVAVLEAPFAGCRPPHFDVPIGDLGRLQGERR